MAPIVRRRDADPATSAATRVKGCDRRVTVVDRPGRVWSMSTMRWLTLELVRPCPHVDRNGSLPAASARRAPAARADVGTSRGLRQRVGHGHSATSGGRGVRGGRPLAATVPSGDWPTFGYDSAHSGAGPGRRASPPPTPARCGCAAVTHRRDRPTPPPIELHAVTVARAPPRRDRRHRAPTAGRSPSIRAPARGSGSSVPAATTGTPGHRRDAGRRPRPRRSSTPPAPTA